MMKFILITVALLFTFMSFANPPDGSAFIDGGKSTSAIILAHGKGKHPKWFVVNPLRKSINQELAFHTLSLQMPIRNGDWKGYANDFPKAYKIIDEAILFLKKRGVSRIILMGHSMGSRMVSSYLSKKPNHEISAVIVVGCRNNGGSPLSCKENLHDIRIPVLDIWGSKSSKDVSAASERTALTSIKYTQIEISGANHKFTAHENELVRPVVSWLRKLP